MTSTTKKVLAFAVGIFLFSRAARAKASTNLPPVDSGGGGASGNPADVSYLGTNNPRGIRNNNPGNLRITSIAWQGKVPTAQNTDGAFEQFTKYKYGIRAMIKDLQNDYRVDGKKSIAALINAYAPPSENQTWQYIDDVASWTGIDAYSVLPDTKPTWKKLVIAMARKENGKVDAITGEQFDQVWTEFNF